ncbi:MAG: cysteine desulfurase-like protein [Fimbriimonas sp.]
MPSHAAVRAHFPALASGFAYLENAGGSQVPASVADAIRDYMLNTYVQTGAGYLQSVAATEVVSRAHAWMETFVNTEGTGRVVLGPSSTALVEMIANAYGNVWQPGDEVIIATNNHEANAGPWAKLASRGVVVREWPVNPETFECEIDDLESLLGPRTKMVAFPHVSNLLGQVADVAAITKIVHAVGARVCVDGVAYAPHRAIDVAAWGVDWYVFSNYKVFGPHMATLFGRNDAFAEIKGPNHFFIPDDAVPYKYELGGISHEACAGLLGLQPYFRFLAERDRDDRETIDSAFQAVEALEQAPHDALLAGLQDLPVRLVGQNPAVKRVPTVSFLHDRLSSPEVVAHVDSANIGIRYGHMYAVRLCKALGIDLSTGVVRVSLAHTSTVDEIDRLLAVLRTL